MSLEDNPSDWVRAFAPATVGNVTCGFDLLGFAVEGWGDIVEARATPESGVHICEVTGDDGRLPTDSRLNTAGVAAHELLTSTGEPTTGVELRLHKGLPLASGLGSSAASGVASALAVDTALGLNSTQARLLAAAVEGERIACGAPHADNAAPSLYGGLVLVRSGVSPEVTPLPTPDGLTAVLLHPHVEVATEAARAVLPAVVPLEASLRQSGDLAALVAGLLSSDYELIASAMVDHIAEPARVGMTPGLEDVRRAALAAGAVGCGLSGSGPTIFAWSRTPDEAIEIERSMRSALRDAVHLDGDSLISPVGAAGARILPVGPTSEPADGSST